MFLSKANLSYKWWSYVCELPYSLTSKDRCQVSDNKAKQVLENFCEHLTYLMLSDFQALSNYGFSKLAVQNQIILLKKKKKVKVCVLFPFDSKGFCIFSAPVLVKNHHSEMRIQCLFSFVITTGMVLQSTQGNMCKQTGEPCVYNLSEFK